MQRNDMRYDETDPASIEAHGRRMIGKSFREIMAEGVADAAGRGAQYAKKGRKGGLGNLVEECWFGYRANSVSLPDFPEAGVELKVTPYEETKKGKLRAKERLVLGMINYMEVVDEDGFERSHLWEKSKLMLLVWYRHTKGQEDMDSTVDHVCLFTPPPEDMAIIRADYEKIVEKIRDGRAHELSEGDTLYLGACTKSSNASKRTSQPFSETPAKPRAFSFKNSYMTSVLKTCAKQGAAYESAVRGTAVTDFERYIMDQIARYRDRRIDDLAAEFGIESGAKNLYSRIVFRILGVKGNQCAEFEKAGIVVKTIRIEHDGGIREHMSFPAIDYRALAAETWEDSTFGSYLRETRFFFVVCRADGAGRYCLKGAQFWNIPAEDLEGDVRKVWQETHDIISEGRLVIRTEKNGRCVNNLPKKKDHAIAHVRPHAKNRDDDAVLPEGTCAWVEDRGGFPVYSYTKQCFWLNNDYILHQLDPALLR